MVMDDDKLKELLQEDMELDADSILEEVNSDPSLKDVVAPEIIHEKLFEQIREHEAERSEEEDELIRLGKIYKKKRSRRKYWVLAAAVLCAFALGITSFGGAEKVFEKLERVLEGRKQTVINNDDSGEDSFSEEIATEEEAYQKIEDEFGIYPIQLKYLPEGMEFVELVVEKELQFAQMYYRNKQNGVIAYKILTNYRQGSIGMDIEDEILAEYVVEKNGEDISIKQYKVSGDENIRYRVDFKHGDAQYFIYVTGLSHTEIEKIIENLHFL